MAQIKAQIHNSITPEELEEARKAVEVINRQLGKEVLTPEYYAEAMRRIDKRLAIKWHREAMKVIEANRRKVEKCANHTSVDTKQRTLIAPSPTLAFLHVYTQRQSDDDHDANYSVNEQPKPGGHSRAFCLLNTAETVEAVRAGGIRHDSRNL